MSATKQVTDILGRQVKRALDDGAEALGDTAKSVAKRRDKTRDTSSQTRGNDHYDGGSPGRPRGDDGRFLPREDGPVDSRYERPSGWRAGLREEAWGGGGLTVRAG